MIAASSPALTTTERTGVAIASTTAIVSAAGWIALLLLAGEMVPRATLISAMVAVAVAACAYRAARREDAMVLFLLAPFAALVPPIGDAPDLFRYIGFLSFGYAVAAVLLLRVIARGWRA